MALTTDQLNRLAAESLGWDNSTAEGVAVIAEDMKLLRRLQLAILPPVVRIWTKQASNVAKNR